MPTALVNGVSMYYELHGDGSPLVLTGGLGADLTLLTPLADDLSHRHQVVTFDNRGAGRSGQPDEPYSIALMAADTLGLMDGLSIERADVLGLSTGGRVAREVALTHPDRVRRPVLVSTGAWTDQDAGADEADVAAAVAADPAEPVSAVEVGAPTPAPGGAGLRCDVPTGGDRGPDPDPAGVSRSKHPGRSGPGAACRDPRLAPGAVPRRPHGRPAQPMV